MRSARLFRLLPQLVLLVAAVTLIALPSSATKPPSAPFYLGRWKIVSGVLAPWVPDGPRLDDRERNSLIGQVVTLAHKFVSGPLGFPCQGPHYEILEGGAEMLFQGTLGEMREKDPKVDPQKLANELGLSGKHFMTIVTGCEFEVDFSFGDDPNVAEFALNNYVYRMERQKAK